MTCIGNMYRVIGILVLLSAGSSSFLVDEFEAAVHAVFKAPRLTVDVTVADVESELASRLSHIAAAYALTAAEIVEDFETWKILRAKKDLTEERVKTIYSQLKQTVLEYNALRGMELASAHLFQSHQPSQAELGSLVQKFSSGVLSSPIIESIEMIPMMGSGRSGADLDEFPQVPRGALNAFAHRCNDIRHLFRIERCCSSVKEIDFTLVYILTNLNLHYLRTRMVLILGERSDLLTELEGIRNLASAALKKALSTLRQDIIESQQESWFSSAMSVLQRSMNRFVF